MGLFVRQRNGANRKRSRLCGSERNTQSRAHKTVAVDDALEPCLIKGRAASAITYTEDLRVTRQGCR